MHPSYKEYRCSVDKKLLFKGLLVESEIEIKCRSCGHMNVIRGDDINEFVCLIKPCPRRVKAKP